MQLNASPTGRPTALRNRLGAAACLLLAAGAPAAARAEDAAPTTQIDASTLFYSENQRTSVVEPEVRVTRLFSNGQSLAAQIGLDGITGASATGGTPSGEVQTVTSASGTVRQVQAGAVPTHMFQDLRGSGDLAWTLPVGALFTATSSIHYSTEKDYRSLGANGTFSLDLLHRLVTVTVGGGVNRDRVNPIGGTVAGLSDGTLLLTADPDKKNVNSAMAGITRVVTRRWLMGVSGTREVERGYLTEPYKVISVLATGSGSPIGALREKRPDLRTRSSVLGSSVYHLTDDVLYTNYRYYWDDWGVRSHTVDLRYRHELGDDRWIQPHVRVYSQTQADFFRYFLMEDSPLPTFASSDNRIGPLRTITLGATYGFRIPNTPGEWGVRAEYMRQWGNGHPADAPGVQRNFNLFPALDVGTLLVTYSLGI
jgi:hypothetical protein